MGLSCEGSADASVQSGIFPAVWKESFQEWRKAGYLLISWDIHFIGDTKTITIRPQISVMQHGFMEGRSSVTNLVEFSIFVIGNENRHQVVYGFFRDGFFRLCTDSARQAWRFILVRDLLPFRSASGQPSWAFVPLH
jgi:hypothetical protein